MKNMKTDFAMKRILADAAIIDYEDELIADALDALEQHDYQAADAAGESLCRVTDSPERRLAGLFICCIASMSDDDLTHKIINMIYE